MPTPRPIRPLVAALCAAALCVLGAARAARADVVSDWESMRALQARNFEKMVRVMPALEETRPRRVFRLRVEGKRLVLRTRLPTTAGDGYARARIDGVGENVLVKVSRGAKPAGGGATSPGGGAAPAEVEGIVPGEFQLNATDYSTPERIVTLAVEMRANYFNLIKSYQFPSGYRNVQLVQQAAAGRAGDGGDLLQLMVNEAGGSDAHTGGRRAPVGGPRPVNLVLEAPDLFTFVRLHPEACDRYLRPLLRDVGQEAAFEPDPLVAWQVFADRWPPDAAARRRVESILPALDADDFRARDRAVRSLLSLGREGAAILLRLDRGDMSVEQNLRLDGALAPYTQLPAEEVDRLRADPAFLLDCLYGDDAALRRAAADRLREVSGEGVPAAVHDDDPDCRAAAVAELRARLVNTAAPTP